MADETEGKRKNTEENSTFPQNPLTELGSLPTKNSRECFYCMSIIGQVEGHYILDEKQKTTKYDHLLPLLVALEESDEYDGILILLNTIGGDVEAGLAIAEVIASMQKPTVSIVLGGGHSIGVPLAVSAKKSFIVPSATMTVHPVRTSGTLIGVPQTFDYLKKMQDRILDFVVSHSKADRSYLERIMMNTDELANDVGSVLDGNAAVQCGLITEIGGISDALSALRLLCREQKEAMAQEE